MLFFLGAKISKDNFTFPSKDSGILTSLHSEYCILFREVNMISDQTRGAKLLSHKTDLFTGLLRFFLLKQKI